MNFFESNVHSDERRGSIEVICGSMFSGKTEELIRRLKRAKIAKQRVAERQQEQEAKKQEQEAKKQQKEEMKAQYKKDLEEYKQAKKTQKAEKARTRAEAKGE